MEDRRLLKKGVSLETYVFLVLMVVFFTYIGSVMGIGNMFNSFFNTAHDLLLNTVFFIMAIAVLTGAISELMSEFGLIALLNKLIYPIMYPLYRLPGVAGLGMITTFLSDNPAIISLAKNEEFKKYFKDYQLPTLCNLGTSFGMGLIVWTFMSAQGQGKEFIAPATIGLIATFFGSIISVRLMTRHTKAYYKENDKADKTDEDFKMTRKVRRGNPLERGLEAILDGGMSGVSLGKDIIPGVLIVCTVVMILTNGPSEINGELVYTGAAYEGVALLPKLGAILNPILKPIFGFSSAESISFPITALGSTGAALGLVPKLLSEGKIGGNDIAVFTALGMSWSGYLSTHVSMMDALDARELTNKALISHTIAGIFAGFFANIMFKLFV